MPAPNRKYIRRRFPGCKLTFIGEPEPSACGWYWFKFEGEEA